MTMAVRGPARPTIVDPAAVPRQVLEPPLNGRHVITDVDSAFSYRGTDPLLSPYST